MLEVRRLEAGASPTRAHEGFHQPQPVVIPRSKIRGQPSQHCAQYVTGQIAASYRRTDQKTVQPNHPVQKSLPLQMRPAHPAVAGAQMQGRSRKTDRTQHTVCTIDQIAHLASRKQGDSQGMLLVHQGVPKRTILGVVHQDDTQPLNRPHGRRNRFRHRYALSQKAGAMLPLPLRRQRRRKREPAPRSQDTQRLNTGGPLRLSRSIKKTRTPGRPRAPARPASLRLRLRTRAPDETAPTLTGVCVVSGVDVSYG